MCIAHPRPPCYTSPIDLCGFRHFVHTKLLFGHFGPLYKFCLNKMDLKALGFSDWFSEHAISLLQPEQELARVVAVDRNAYLVRGESKELSAELSGRFRFAVEFSPDLPCVGDWVSIHEASPELAIIHGVVPRKSFLRRKTPGTTVGVQMVAANIDAAFVVQSCHYDFNIRRLDRYLVACSDGGVEPVIILSKTDLLSQEEVDGLVCDLRASGITAQIVPVSSTKGIGLECQRAGKTSQGCAGENQPPLR